MGNAIVIALSNLACIWLTAFVIQRITSGRSVVPSIPRKVDVENDNGDGIEQEMQPAKGRPVL